MNPHESHGAHDAVASSLSIVPMIGTVFFLLLLVLAGLYLWRRGWLTLPNLGRRRSPEDDAKHILAQRFANGDLTSEEFMERSSVLNWTPGVEAVPPRSRKPGR